MYYFMSGSYVISETTILYSVNSQAVPRKLRSNARIELPLKQKNGRVLCLPLQTNIQLDIVIVCLLGSSYDLIQVAVHASFTSLVRFIY